MTATDEKMIEVDMHTLTRNGTKTARAPLFEGSVRSSYKFCASTLDDIVAKH